MRSAVYYALRRHRIEIPYPIQIEYPRFEPPKGDADRAARVARLLANVDLLKPLTDADRASLARSSEERLYGRGEPIVRQGQPGASMFVLCSGSVRVIVEPSGLEVAVIRRGGYFGEMSLLTGEPRTATVAAVEDSVLLEITADVFREVVLANPAVLDEVSLVVASRRTALDRAKAAVSDGAAEPDGRPGLLSLVREFLRL